MSRARQQILRLAAVLLLTLISASFALPAQAQDELCFAETKQCIAGRFRQYWEHNGGLAVFGFPLTPARQERNRDTGQTYLTQWFERNRFELHPENPAPYDVLLGRLGNDRLVQLGRSWQAEPREPGPRNGCRWFAETGHNVCDQEQGSGIKTYWETHGLADPRLDSDRRSLALFGLPLTAPRMETNSSGDTVLTQWFERARFEWHPDKPHQFKVLLGRLGDEIARAAIPVQSLRGRIAYVSREAGASGADLYIMNADGSGQTRLTTNAPLTFPSPEYALSPAGDRLAYRERGDLVVIRADGTGRQVIVSGPVPRQPEFEIFSPTWAPDSSYLAFVWQGDIYASRADGSPPVRITTIGEATAPACLSWARNGYLSFRTPARHTFKLFVVRSDGTDLRQVAWGLCGNLSPAGDRMVYMNGDLWLVNLDGTNPRALTGGRNYLRGIWSPDGTRIATVGYDSDNPASRDIFVIDPTNGQARRLTTVAQADILPAWSPDGNFIAFASQQADGYGIYVMRADGTGQTRLPAHGESSAPQWAPR